MLMMRREPTAEDTIRLLGIVRDAAWGQARTLSGLQPHDPPRSPFDEDTLDAKGQQAAVLAHLAALRDVRDMAEKLIAMTVTVAGDTGASGELIGAALGVTRSGVRKAYPDAVMGSPGPKRPKATLRGRETWARDTEDRPADRDWVLRARVRLRTDVRTGGFGVDRVGQAGQELVMVMGGRTGAPVALDAWATEEPADRALFAYTASVELLEVLEMTSPWSDRDLDPLPSSYMDDATWLS